LQQQVRAALLDFDPKLLAAGDQPRILLPGTCNLRLRNSPFSGCNKRVGARLCLRRIGAV
jgi:hypothetical protein